jgi:hypothetical protein
MNCLLKYLGEIGRAFTTRVIKNIYRQLGIIIAIWNIRNTYSTWDIHMGVSMDIIKTEKEGKHHTYIYKISKHRLHKNDTYIDTHNPIFETPGLNIRQEHTHPIYSIYKPTP